MNEPKKKVTIYDVAKHANVSTATVSRVINKNYSVDPETAEKVESAIAATGYYPNAIAQTMRRKASFSIGLIVDDLNNNHFTLIAKTIDQNIEAKNYNLIVCSSDGKRNSERNYIQTLMCKKVDGLVIHTSGENDNLIADISRELPVILVYRKIESESFAGDFVGSDDFTGGYKLGRHVLAHGHSRIGVICGDLSVSTGRERFAGFQQALAESGIALPPDLVCSGSYHFESGIASAEALLSVTPRPTAIVALSNALAMGAMARIREKNLRIPDDVSFASFGELAVPMLLFVKPTVINQYPARIGEVVAELLLKRIQDPGRPSELVFIPSYLQQGDSLKNIGPAIQS